jgi:hypothetical protein
MMTQREASTVWNLEGTVEGFRGKRSRSAFAAFQGKSGLPATGELDGETENKLLSEAFTPAN